VSGHAELLLAGARVVDGTGAPARTGDVAVSDGRIAAIGDLSGWTAGRRVDLAGRVLAPGFIDVHTHDDRALLSDKAMTAKVSQGVTSVIAGNCGISLAPYRTDAWPPPPLDLLGDQAGYRFERFADWVAALAADPPAVNYALLVGHTTLRHKCMAALDRTAAPDELALMDAEVTAALEAGAIGLSTGLDYPNAVAADTDEVVRLARAAAAQGGLYVTHTRNYFEQVEAALEEAFEIGRRAAVPVVLSHHQVSGRGNFGRSRRTLARIEQVRRQQSVGLDAYPYAASSKTLDPERCAAGVEILITWSRPVPEAAGRKLADLARDWDLPERAAAERLLPAGAIYFQLDPDDVDRIVCYPPTMIGSDGIATDVKPHPRLWGTFPRVLGRYVRERGLLTLEQAVHKMTGLPAATFGFAGRGVLRAGAVADLVAFDPDRVADTASFDDPIRAADGIELVLVGGVPVWDGGVQTAARPGHLLRRSVPQREGVAA
jgi:N-acyl-D-amino-acid deacylase